MKIENMLDSQLKREREATQAQILASIKAFDAAEPQDQFSIQQDLQTFHARLYNIDAETQERLKEATLEQAREMLNEIIGEQGWRVSATNRNSITSMERTLQLCITMETVSIVSMRQAMNVLLEVGKKFGLDNIETDTQFGFTDILVNGIK